jgi:cell division protein FtsX
MSEPAVGSDPEEVHKLDVQQLAAWLKRLIYLDTRVFEEVRSNPTATLPSFIVVSVAMFLAGLGGWLWWVLQDFGSNSDILVHSAFIGSVLAIVLWGVWLIIVYFLLTQVFRQRAYLEQLLRVMASLRRRLP